VRKDEDLIGRGSISRGETIVLRNVIYKLSIVRGGAVFGEIRAPHHARLDPLVAASPRDWLQLKLDDGRWVFFQLRRAESSAGGWGDLEGRLSP
jgi:hypothetical protein